MIKSILVCIEGSPATGRAMDLGIDLARALGARVTGLSIVDEPDIRAGAATGIGGTAYKHQRDDALVADGHRRAEEWLAGFSERCRAAGVAATPLERRGRPADVILEETLAHDLTILGQRTNFRHETDAADDTRDVVLHRAAKPVLLVPSEKVGLGDVVLLAYDGSTASKRAVRSFAESGLATARRIHVLTVDDDGATAWERAMQAVGFLSERGIKAEPHNVVTTLPVPDAIFETARKLGAGFLVMGAYTHSRLTNFLWGSVTRALAEKTVIPLYLQH